MARLYLETTSVGFASCTVTWIWLNTHTHTHTRVSNPSIPSNSLTDPITLISLTWDEVSKLKALYPDTSYDLDQKIPRWNFEEGWTPLAQKSTPLQNLRIFAGGSRLILCARKFSGSRNEWQILTNPALTVAISHLKQCPPTGFPSYYYYHHKLVSLICYFPWSFQIVLCTSSS